MIASTHTVPAMPSRETAPRSVHRTPCDRGAVLSSLGVSAESFYMRGVPQTETKDISMASPKRLYRVSCLIDDTHHWTLLDLLEKSRAMNVESVIVRHGGEDESGQLQSRPKARDIITAFAASRPQFTSKEVKAEGERLGASKMSIGAMLYIMKDEGTLKFVGPATFALNTKTSKPSKGARRTPPTEKKARGKPGDTVHEAIVKIVREKQNGTGEGVSVKEIKKAMNAAGFKASGASPAITRGVRDKLLKKVGGGRYRTVEA